jgi:hypothetical protein
VWICLVLTERNIYNKRKKRLYSQTRSEIKRRHRATFRSEYRSKKSHFCTFSAFTYTNVFCQYLVWDIFTYICMISYPRKRCLSCAKLFANSLRSHYSWTSGGKVIALSFKRFLSQTLAYTAKTFSSFLYGNSCNGKLLIYFQYLGRPYRPTGFKLFQFF